MAILLVWTEFEAPRSLKRYIIMFHPPVDAAVGIGVHAETACQTDEAICSISELLAVKGQLRSTTQRLRRSQMKLAKMTALVSRQKRQHTDTQKLSAREKLIFDQCLMKANAKSPTAVR